MQVLQNKIKVFFSQSMKLTPQENEEKEIWVMSFLLLDFLTGGDLDLKVFF